MVEEQVPFFVYVFRCLRGWQRDEGAIRFLDDDAIADQPVKRVVDFKIDLMPNVRDRYDSMARSIDGRSARVDFSFASTL